MTPCNHMAHWKDTARGYCLLCESDRRPSQSHDAVAARMRAKYLHQGKGCATRRKLIAKRTGEAA